jgi:hypothetical protein
VLSTRLQELRNGEWLVPPTTLVSIVAVVRSIAHKVCPEEEADEERVCSGDL